MNWKHAYLRNATDEENKELGCEEIWGGELPELDEEVLIYQNGHYSIDYMTDVDVDGGLALYDSDYDDFYWCELEAPDTGNGG